MHTLLEGLAAQASGEFNALPPDYYQHATHLGIRMPSGEYSSVFPAANIFVHEPSAGLTYHMGITVDAKEFAADSRPTEYDPKHEPPRHCQPDELPLNVKTEALRNLLSDNRIVLFTRRLLVAAIVDLIPTEVFGHKPTRRPELIFPPPLPSVDCLDQCSKKMVALYLKNLRAEVNIDDLVALQDQVTARQGVPMHLTEAYQRRNVPLNPRAISARRLPYLSKDLNLHTYNGIPPTRKD